MADYRIYYMHAAYDDWVVDAENAEDALQKFRATFDRSSTPLEVTYQ